MQAWLKVRPLPHESEVRLVNGTGATTHQASLATSRPRSWAKEQVRAWGWRNVQWRKVGDGTFVADCLL